MLVNKNNFENISLPKAEICCIDFETYNPYEGQWFMDLTPKQRPLDRIDSKMVAFQAVRSAGLPLACCRGVSRGVGRPHGRDWRYGPVSPRARLLRRCLRR